MASQVVRASLTKFNFKQTLLGLSGHRAYEQIMSAPVQLPHLRELRIEFTNHGPGRTGTRYFIKNRAPIIRFHNAQVDYKVQFREKEEDVLPKIHLTFENGETETIEANKKHEFEILDEIVNAHESFAANFTPAAN